MEYSDSLSIETERSALSERERNYQIIFGGVAHAMSLEDIGDHFGITRERVRQIKDKAIQS